MMRVAGCDPTPSRVMLDGVTADRNYLGHRGIARVLGIDEATVRHYKRKGYLPAPVVFVDGVGVGWAESDIRAWNAKRPGSGSRTDLPVDRVRRPQRGKEPAP